DEGSGDLSLPAPRCPGVSVAAAADVGFIPHRPKHAPASVLASACFREGDGLCAPPSACPRPNGYKFAWSQCRHGPAMFEPCAGPRHVPPCASRNYDAACADWLDESPASPKPTPFVVSADVRAATGTPRAHSLSAIVALDRVPDSPSLL